MSSAATYPLSHSLAGFAGRIRLRPSRCQARVVTKAAPFGPCGPRCRSSMQSHPRLPPVLYSTAPRLRMPSRPAGPRAGNPRPPARARGRRGPAAPATAAAQRQGGSATSRRSGAAPRRTARLTGKAVPWARCAWRVPVASAVPVVS